MTWWKILVTGGLIALAETLHGIGRARFLAPRIGDLRSRQIGVLSGSALLLIIAYISIPWISPATISEAMITGLAWLALMLGYEFCLGRLLFKFSWKRLLSDFNPLEGGFLGIGMSVLVFAPLLAAKMRRLF
ncbi:MAG TPA: hypothetical protein PK876_03360 [Elusimicrobiota bacterium]|nr:hypothetical protein [Elusimicrobiota bacterium]